MSNKDVKNNKSQKEVKKEHLMERNPDQSNTSKEKASPKKKKKKETVVQKEQKQKTKEKEAFKKRSAAPSTVVEGSGINLIPSMSDEEIESSEKKKKINVTSLVSISLLLLISILVVGFNIISKVQLNTQQEKINEQERTIQDYSDILSGNTEILERVFLYKDIQEGIFSSTLVIEHFRDQVSKTGGSSIDGFSFPGTEGFEFSGKSQSLEDVSKLWYLLVNDEKIYDLELKTLSKSAQGASFSFRGKLVIEEFMTSSNTE